MTGSASTGRQASDRNAAPNNGALTARDTPAFIFG
jgi:hypothetical protein